LKNIRQDHDQAEKYYKKALELAPNDADINGNYASFLLIFGKVKQAENHISIAFKEAGNNKQLLLVLWFYRLAHFPEFREQAVSELDSLLASGVKSHGWDFSGNIKQAKKEGFEPISLLFDYAEKISGKKLSQK